jgi:hypothetical protein
VSDPAGRRDGEAATVAEPESVRAGEGSGRGPTVRPSVAQAFAIAAAELGMCSAAWLFVRETAAEGGDALVGQLRDRLGRDYPVLDSVAASWLDGARSPAIDTDGVLGALRGITRLVVVGLETAFLDALLPKLPGCRVSLLTHGELDADWSRVLANYPGRIEPTDFGSFQALAGNRSALLTFAYGVREPNTHVAASWLRVSGADVRTQFRALVAWDVLRAQMYVYPRWLVEARTVGFSHVV